MNTNENKIIGVSTLALDAVERIPIGTIKNTDFIVCDMDSDRLERSSVQNKILLGTGKIERLSLERQIELGMDSVLNSELNLAMNSAIDGFDELDSLFMEGSKTVILIAPVGCTTGAGATPVIAQIAKRRGLFVVAIVLEPFDFEGEMKTKIANKTLKKLREDCDFVLVLKYSKLGKLYGNLGFKSSFGKIDDIVIRLAKTVLPSVPINNDWLDLKLFYQKHQNDEPFFIGIGQGVGNDRAKEATELALKSTLSERETFEGVSNVVIQINCGSIKITTDEIGQMKDAILNALENKGSITVSISQDILLGDKLSVLIIAY
jgi:cell division protein FtsZ